MTTLEIVISEKVKEFIRRKGGVVQLSLYETMNKCCIGGAAEIEILYQKPENEVMYYKIHQDQIDFYVLKSLNFKNNKVCIELAGIGFFKGLKATGLQRF